MINDNMEKFIQSILTKRYYLKGEDYVNYWQEAGEELTWGTIAKRVSHVVSGEDYKKFDKYFNLISSKTFLPNSPTLFGAGVRGICLSACFVIRVKDTIEGWGKAFSDAMKIQVCGGGIGFDLSDLRPRGSKCGKRAKAAGVVAFMRCWNAITSEFKQSVRNGATLCKLSVLHSEIVDFIKCKEKDGELSHMNISVAVTDEFLRNVEAEEETGEPIYHGVWDGWNYSCGELWKLICEQAHKSGEPGIIFEDTVEKGNNHPELGKLLNNPCAIGETRINTVEFGLVEIQKLVGRNYHTYDFNGNPQIVNKTWKSGVRQCIKIILRSGMEFIVTPDHKFMTENGEWIEANKLMGESIKINKILEWNGMINKVYEHCDFKLLGCIFGDGVYHRESKRVKFLCIGKNDNDILEYIRSNHLDQIITKTPRTDIFHIKRGYCDQLFNNTLPLRNIPEWVFYLPKKELSEFLQGLYSANGFVIASSDNYRISLKMTNKKIIQDVQKLLLLFGIDSFITKENGKKVKFDNGTYWCKSNYTLKICHIEDMYKFQKEIGFIHEYKNIKVQKCIDDILQTKPIVRRKANPHMVVDIKKDKEYEVFDFTQEFNNSGSFCNYITHNCQEFVGHDYSACNLGSINLTKFVEGRLFNFQKFEKVIATSYEFLDDLIDVNPYPLPEIDKRVKELRPIGLGVMGLADVFIMLGYRYGDEQSIDLTDRIFWCMKSVVEWMNHDLGKQKGNYPLYKIRDGNSYRRNVTMNAIAPCGSISILAGCSSGIEPVYAFNYTRRVQSPDSITEEVELQHPFKSGDPHIDVTANELSVEDHIAILSTAQKYIDMSISKTINLKNDATVQDVENAFKLCHENGVKGITVYRDGCRENQVLSTTKEKEVKTDTPIKNFPKDTPGYTITREEALLLSRKNLEKAENGRKELDIDYENTIKPTPSEVNVRRPPPTDEEIERAFIIPRQYPIKPVKRPDVLHGFSHKVKIGCGNLYVTVNKDESGKVLEVLVEPGKNGGCDSNSEAIARLISLCLRCNVDVKEIIEQLRGIKCISCVRREGVNSLSCPDAVSKILEKHYKGKESVINKRTENLMEETILKTGVPTMNGNVYPSDRFVESVRKNAGVLEDEKTPCFRCNNETDNGDYCPECLARMKKEICVICKRPTEHIGDICDSCTQKQAWNKSTPLSETPTSNSNVITCPECEHVMRRSGDGCWSCDSCGYSKCG